MRGKALITQQEVLIRTGMLSLGECAIPKINTTIWYEFKDCLGIAFYEELISYLADYSDSESYDLDSPYTIDEVVKYNGVYWVATESVLPGSEPSYENQCWDLAPKFSKPCLNDLWCDGSLGDYLAYVVMKGAITPNSLKFTSEGIVRPVSKDYEPVSARDRESLIAHYATCAQCEFDKIDWYMKNNNEDCCFDLYKGIANGCCGDCGCKPLECSCEDGTCSKTDEFDLTIW